MFEKLTSDAPAMPSLNALRAFEAMARTGRATLAAEELCVTHSAVSRQVKALERRLAVRLFQGPRHDLKLTEAGRRLLADLSPAFDAIAAAVLKVRTDADALVIAANASLSVKWLVPRLAGFAALRPDIRIEVVELAAHATSHRGAHAVLRLVGADQLERPNVTRLMANYIGPVAATADHDLLAAPRLTSSTHPSGWADWSRLTGVVLRPAPERKLPHLHVALEAATAGLGAAVLPWPIVCDDVRAGRLAVVGRFAREAGGVALIASPGEPSRALKAFTAWIADEARATIAGVAAVS